MGAKNRPKTGGRKKGSVNKKTAEVQAKLAAYDDPLDGMIALAQWARDERSKAETMPEKMKCADLEGKMLAELAGYKHPKRKAVEGGPPGSAPVQVVVKWND